MRLWAVQPSSLTLAISSHKRTASAARTWSRNDHFCSDYLALLSGRFLVKLTLRQTVGYIDINGVTVGTVTLYQDRCSLRYHGHTASNVGNSNLYADVRDSAGGPVSNTGFGTGLDSPEVPNGSNAHACGYVEYFGNYPTACAP